MYIPRFRGHQDNFYFWSAQIKAILKAKKAWKVVRPTSGTVSTTDGSSQVVTATSKKLLSEEAANDIACSVILQGLGEVPFAAVMQYQDDPQKMWNVLHERYAAVSSFSKASIHTSLARLKYGGENMDSYLSKWERYNAQLAAMGSPLDESLLISMFFESFGSRSESRFGGAISAMLTRENVSWQQVCARMLEEHKSGEKIGTDNDKEGQSEQANSANAQKGKRKVKCYYCDKVGHVVRDCYKLKADRKRKNGGENRKATDDDRALSARPAGIRNRLGNNNKMVAHREAIVDSGATVHMVKDDRLIKSSRRKVSTEIATAGKSSIKAEIEGKARVRLTGGKRSVEMSRVLCVPELRDNLLSVGGLCDDGHKVLFTKHGCTVWHGTSVVGRGRREGGVYTMKYSEESIEEKALNVEDNPSSMLETWHARFGHADRRAIKRMADKNMVRGLSLQVKKYGKECEACISGTMTNGPMKSKSYVTDVPGTIVHSDVAEMNLMSLGSAKYFVTFVDEASGHVRVMHLKSKGDAGYHLRKYVKWVERQTGNRVKKIVIDGGKEYISEAETLELEGVEIDKSARYTPQENGRAERMNRTLKNSIRAMLINSGAPANYWAECLYAAADARNSLVRAGCTKCPLELLTGVKPTVEHLRTFGCRVWVRIPDKIRKTLEPKARKAVLLRCLSYGKYRVMMEGTRTVQISRHCKVVEGKFPMKYWKNVSRVREDCFDDEALVEQFEEFESEDGFGNSNIVNTCEQSSETDKESPAESASINEDEVDEESEKTEPVRRRSNRVSKPPERYQDVAMLSIEDPTTYEEAMNSPEKEDWKQALKSELDSIHSNRTWVRANLPAGRMAIPCKVVWKKKLDDAGKVARYKARVVAKGFHQRYGVDYDETFAPVVSYDALLVALGIAVSKEWHIHHADISTAFLNGIIDGEVYVEWGGVVYRLLKSLYGLKQSPRLWYQRLSAVLLEYGFRKFQSSECLFVKGDGAEKVVLAVYVDDLIIMSPNRMEVDKTKEKLRVKFKLEDLGELRYYLGIKFERNGRKMILNQEAYCQRILKRFGMDQAASCPTPMVANIDELLKRKTVGEKEQEEMEKFPYRALVGSLLYLSCHTRPDISFAVGVLARFLDSPSLEHWKAGKRVLRYLVGTSTKGIVVGSEGSTTEDTYLSAYCDSDWAGDVSDRKSTGAYIVLLNGGIITWKSYKQKCTAVSSTEAEYIALSECVQKLRYVRKVANELGMDENTTIVYEDNQACMKWAEVQGKRTKHIDVRYHVSREAVENKEVALKYCPSKEMIADALTKPLGPEKYSYLVTKMPMTEGIE